MRVWVVVVPQDYQSAEIVGVYYSEKDALKAKKNRAQEDDRTVNIQVQEHSVE